MLPGSINPSFLNDCSTIQCCVGRRLSSVTLCIVARTVRPRAKVTIDSA